MADHLISLVDGRSSYVNRPPARDAERPVDRQSITARELRRLPSVHDGETAYARHKRFMAEYGGRLASGARAAAQSAPARSEYDVVREHSRFVWRAEDGASKADGLSWEERVAKLYYDRLFKEYAIADLSRYESGQVGLRWRTEREVVDGKGQFVCGSRTCGETVGLKSYEVNFRYVERSERRSTLVKLRACESCARKLNHRFQHNEAKPPSHAARGSKRRLDSLDADENPHTSVLRRSPERAAPASHKASAAAPAAAACGGGTTSADTPRATAVTPAANGADATSIWGATEESVAADTSEVKRADDFEDYLLSMLL